MDKAQKAERGESEGYPWSRLRDQAGMGFLMLSNTFVAGAAAALFHEQRRFMAKPCLWWADRALMLELTSVILLQAPWAMRAIFGTPPSSAMRSVARSFFPALCFAVVLAAIDSAVLQAAIFWGPVEFLIAACVPAIACTFVAVRTFGRGIRGFVALLPAVCYFNVLLMSWVAQFAAPVVMT